MGTHARAHTPTHTRACRSPIYCVSTAFRYSLCEGECGSEGCDISPYVAHRVLLTPCVDGLVCWGGGGGGGSYVAGIVC